jgi:perosamine synthetase
MTSSAPMIPVAKPFLGEEEAQAAARAIGSRWITQGPEVAAFESEFAAYVGAPFACAVSNCTAALHLALLAVGVEPGDEVITVSHSFVATANAVVYCGAKPVFVDIEADTYNIDPARVEEAVTERTAAILAVHQLGMPCDLARLKAIAERHQVPLVEDAACAIGSDVEWGGAWQRIGRPHADIACFSFHPRKVLTTGDGGMLTTAREGWDRQFRLWRQHGMSANDRARHASSSVVFESYSELGFNYRLTDIQAAVGREQLKRLPGMIERRRQLAGRYLDALGTVSGLVLPRQPEWARSNWQSFCVVLPEGADQKQVMQRMLDAGVSTRRGVMCAHREPHHADHAPRPLPISEAVQDRGLILPLYHELTAADQDRVVQALRDALATRG